MPTVVFQQRVKDYSKWRPVFNSNEPMRTEYGFADTRVYRNADDENDLLIMLDIDSKARLRDFVADVRKTQEAGGVIMSTVSVRILPAG